MSMGVLVEVVEVLPSRASACPAWVHRRAAASARVAVESPKSFRMSLIFAMKRRRPRVDDRNA
jgi:hypothetical protein